MDERENIYKKVKSILQNNEKRSTYIGEDDFVSLSKGEIKINFHIKNPHLDIENIFRVIKRSQKIIKERFGYDLLNLHIDIYNSIDEMREEGKSNSRYASWIAGIYDGKIRIISEKESEEPEALYIILTHEIIHLAINNITHGLCPYWLDEGVAIFLSQELSESYIKILIKAIKNDQTLPLEILEKPLPPEIDESIRRLAYSQMFSIIEFFNDFYKWDKIKTIICQSRRRPILTILRDFGLNYYLLEQAWKRWFRNKNA